MLITPRHTRWSLAFALLLPVAVAAQTTKAPTAPKAAKPKPETQAQLQKEATVTLEAATTTALAQVPGGKVSSHELEREDGKLIYSFDIKVAGKSGVEEINVDAKTGTVVAKEHESDAAEAKEKAAEKKATPPKKTGGLE